MLRSRKIAEAPRMPIAQARQALRAKGGTDGV
jgi:hypothetical protein